MAYLTVQDLAENMVPHLVDRMTQYVGRKIHFDIYRQPATGAIIMSARMRQGEKVVQIDLPIHEEYIVDHRIDAITSMAETMARKLKKVTMNIPLCDCMIERVLQHYAEENRDIDWRPTEALPEDYYAL